MISRSVGRAFKLHFQLDGLKSDDVINVSSKGKENAEICLFRNDLLCVAILMQVTHTMKPFLREQSTAIKSV